MYNIIIVAKKEIQVLYQIYANRESTNGRWGLGDPPLTAANQHLSRNDNCWPVESENKLYGLSFEYRMSLRLHNGLITHQRYEHHVDEGVLIAVLPRLAKFDHQIAR